MRILIVEDEALVALSIDDALSAAGHTIVSIARDEATAVDMAERFCPDLALVDLNLAHEGSGATVALALRQRYAIPSIFVSGAPQDCRKANRLVGVLGCLTKPFSDDELVGAVEVAQALIGGRKPAAIPPSLELYVVV